MASQADAHMLFTEGSSKQQSNLYRNAREVLRLGSLGFIGSWQGSLQCNLLPTRMLAYQVVDCW
jgi:hypothetical protein